MTVVILRISAICRQHTRNNSHEVDDQNISLPITLICDNIRDAGTLGTLIRSAAAACCRTMLITRGNYYRVHCLPRRLCILSWLVSAWAGLLKKWTRN